MRIGYINAMVSEPIGEAYKAGLIRGLKSSGFPIEVVSMDLNYGRGWSPKQMSQWAENNQVAAVVLSGSEKNTTDREDPWIQDYYFGLKELLHYRGDPQDWMGPPFAVMGICFGHQALSCALGGETARFGKRRGLVAWSTLPTAKSHRFFRRALDEDRGRCLAIHSDHVIRLPRDFIPMATSLDCLIEAMAHRQWPIVSLQSHPEMDSSVLQVPEEAVDWVGVDPNDFSKSDGPKILRAFALYAKEEAQRPIQ